MSDQQEPNPTRQAVIDAMVHEVVPTMRNKYRRILSDQLPNNPDLTLIEYFDLAVTTGLRTYSTSTQVVRSAKKLWLEPGPPGSDRAWQPAYPNHKGGS